MKKALFLAAAFLFFGCTSSLESKNADCQKYMDVFPENPRTTVAEIFYSSKVKSCLVIVIRDDSIWDSDLEKNVFTLTKKLISAPNEEIIFESAKTSFEQLPQDNEFIKFEEVVSEYKN